VTGGEPSSITSASVAASSKSQIDALPGQRMHHMGGVADQGQTGFDVGASVLQSAGEKRRAARLA
jgi:hypothetical protein